jgi:predicted ester cyclase
MSVSQAHKELFGRLYHSIWNERRMEFLDLVIADTHALGDPTVAGGAVGPSAYKRQVERFLTGLPDLRFEVHENISEGDRLVDHYRNAPRRVPWRAPDQ